MPERTVPSFGKLLAHLVSRPTILMEVCGTHTVSIFRSGIRSLLPEGLTLLSGPGCPVCVTDQSEIDAALSLASLSGVTVTTFGDLLRVPGRDGSLLDARGRSADVRIVTSAFQALETALREPERQVVFLAPGFETTAPSTAAVVLEAAEKKTANFSVLSLHKLVPPVLRVLAADPELAVDGLLLPGHVSVILGEAPYSFLSERHGIACAIAGFEAEEILLGLTELLRQIHTNRPTVRSLYGKAVRPEGNARARELMERVFHPVDAPWRGLGVIPSSGLALREEFLPWDAAQRFPLPTNPAQVETGCRCGDILTGKLTPPECPLFDNPCTPASPVGPCMVSSEGSCAAHYRYALRGTP